MHEGWLREVQTSCDITSQSEIGVLVDGAGNQAGNLRGYFFVFAEDVREGVREGGSTLDGTKVDFAYTRTGKIRT